MGKKNANAEAAEDAGDTLSPSDVAKWAELLSTFSALLSERQSRMESLGIQSVEAKNLKSMRLGCDNVQKFIKHLDESIVEAKHGTFWKK